MICAWKRLYPYQECNFDAEVRLCVVPVKNPLCRVSIDISTAQRTEKESFHAFRMVEIPFSKLNLFMETVAYFKMSSIDIHCRSILLKLLHNIAFYITGASLASTISSRCDADVTEV